MATFGELAKQSSMQHWSLSGRQQLVKVVSAAGYEHMGSKPPEDQLVGGYITEKRYLWGLTNRQIEKVLGLRPFELKHVAFVFGLSRLPTADEVDFRLSAAFPDGKSPYDEDGKLADSYTQGLKKAQADFQAGKGTTDRSNWPVVDFYPMGSGQVPQWKIRPNVRIPTSGLMAIVTDAKPFPRENGSTKPYTPHNRGSIHA